MKKILLVLGALLSLSTVSFGQCTVDTTHFSGSTYVYPASQSCITTNTPFTGQINIKVPQTLDANYFVSQIPSGYIMATIDSINIMTVTGYPAGISGADNPALNTWLHPNDYACDALSGTVNGNNVAAGNYPLTITGTGCGHFTYNGTNYSQCMTNFNFSRVYPYSLSVCYATGISEIAGNVGLNIYPNPNQGNFTVTVSSSDPVTGIMSVIDQIGRTINTQSLDVSGTKQIQLELGNVAPGSYMLMIETSAGKSIRQFIIK